MSHAAPRRMRSGTQRSNIIRCERRVIAVSPRELFQPHQLEHFLPLKSMDAFGARGLIGLLHSGGYYSTLYRSILFQEWNRL